MHCGTYVPKRLTRSHTVGGQDLTNQAVAHPLCGGPMRALYRACLGLLIKYLRGMWVQLRPRCGTDDG